MRLFQFIKNHIRTPEDKKGARGERALQRSLIGLDFWGYDGHCLRNLYIPRENGTTAEIDLVYITRKGIFVIESKNYAGYIFGDEKRQKWTSTLYSGKDWLGRPIVEKNQFYNPILQNRGHITALKKFCGDMVCHSIIAFGNESEFKDFSWDSDEVTVCYYSELKHVIKEIWNSTSDLYEDRIVNEVYEKLKALDGSREVREKHVKQIQETVPGLLCPRCGGNLVKRTAKNGPNAGNEFYGCSNYPKCRYIRNIENM